MIIRAIMSNTFIVSILSIYKSVFWQSLAVVLYNYFTFMSIPL